MSDHAESSTDEHAGALGFERIVFPRERAARRDLGQGATGA